MDIEWISSFEEIEKTCQALKLAGIDFALLTSIENVTYVSGFEVPIPVGPTAAFSEMLPLSMALISTQDRKGWLIVARDYMKKAERESSFTNIVPFDVFESFEKVNSEQSYLLSIRSVLEEAGLRGTSATLGIESPTLPTNIYELICNEYSTLRLVDSRASLQKARSIKTKREISLLRNAARVADAGQEALLKLSKSFNQYSEIDLWAEIEKQMILAAGGRVTITGELVTGPRITHIAPGGPVQRQVNRGEAGLMDISPRVRGYWADCTNTVIFGSEPTKEQRKYFVAARESFEAVVEVLRPGVRCCDVEAAVRKTFERHGFPVAHYSGHQIGVSVNEYPKLVPYDTTVIEAGMVFAVEPGAYEGPGGKHGARAERMVLVTDSGPEILSGFQWGII